MKTTDQTEKIKAAITNFVKGGDTSNADLLDRVLHAEFRVSNNGFMGKPGVAIITKEQYLNNIRSGVFGGLPRKMTIEQVEQDGAIAMVKIRLESAENHFVSFNSMVLDTDGEWRLVHNLAVVVAK